MSYLCHSCSKDVSDEISAGKTGRSRSCSKCQRDLHACKNCKHYDPSAYNQCRESSAERVVDKERANFCDYFSFRPGGNSGGKQEGSKDYMQELDKLFK